MARSLFLRGLAIVYLIAFISLLLQVNGLIGSNGLLGVCTFALALHEHPMFERNRCSVVGNAVIRPVRFLFLVFYREFQMGE